MYSAAAICRSTHLPIPQEGRIITSDDVFGHLPDIRCINGGIDAAPAPPLDGAGQCAGLPGVLSEAAIPADWHLATAAGTSGRIGSEMATTPITHCNGVVKINIDLFHFFSFFSSY